MYISPEQGRVRDHCGTVHTPCTTAVHLGSSEGSDRGEWTPAIIATSNWNARHKNTIPLWEEADFSPIMCCLVPSDLKTSVHQIDSGVH